ncbi:hypothetical protein Tco_0751529 [Tanacetum coccineum]|uniref:Uncharacterized protein n=1 Tax=Tanacetum coccineum TaxID=301880 RepID=A0ABQ4Z4B1_9ASTR
MRQSPATCCWYNKSPRPRGRDRANNELRGENEPSPQPKDDYDVVHFDNSSDLALSTSLNDLDFATLHIDGQSIDVDVPPDIIDVDEDDDIIDDEDTLPHDLEDSDNKDLVNVDDDDVAVVYFSEEED